MNLMKQTERTTVPTTKKDWRNSRVGWLLSCLTAGLIIGAIVAYFGIKWSDSVVPAALESTFSPPSPQLRSPNKSASPSSAPTVPPTVAQTPNPTTMPPTLVPTIHPSLVPTIHPTTKYPTQLPTPQVTHFQPLDRPIRIACVGDSLTRGTSGGVSISHSYPSQLQQMLGEKFEVHNYGRNAMTAIRGLGVSYVSKWQFQASLDVEPDIYLLMLGTNDASYWGVHGHKYRGDMEWIINKVQSISMVSPRIIVAIPPWVKNDGIFGIHNDILINGVQPAIQNIVALDEYLQLVNMYDVTYNQADMFVDDGLHFNQKGSGALAAAWKTAIECNHNGICEAGENCTTCPGDCHLFC